MQYLFYTNENQSQNFVCIDSSYRYEFWHPGWISAVPKGLNKLSAYMWWLFHQLRFFTNREYGIFLIYDHRKLIHRSFIFPRYFRFPFMAKEDLQIGDTFTAPDYRGKGLATFAIQEILKIHQCKKNESRKIWYLVAEENIASIQVIEKTGFKLLGKGQKKKRLGLSIFGYYEIDQHIEH